MLERLKDHIHNLCSKWNVLVIEFVGEDNHIHLLFSYYPQLDLCKFINNLKTVTSRLIRKEFEQELNQTYRGKAVLWNGSYFIASCGGVTVDVLRKYIEGQEVPVH
ncbi:transposase [Lyngbya sp. PCC 8106]|nr:transposase [Lyngbya sp. PCC 8106]